MLSPLDCLFYSNIIQTHVTQTGPAAESVTGCCAVGLNGHLVRAEEARSILTA